MTGTVWARERGSTVGSAAGNLIHMNEAGFAIGHTDDDHALMKKRGVEAGNRGFLAAVLRAGGSKHASDLANKRTLQRESAGLVKEVAHLGGHVSETSGGTENEGVRVGKLIDRGDRHFRKSGLGCPRAVFLKYIVRNEFRHLT